VSSQIERVSKQGDLTLSKSRLKQASNQEKTDPLSFYALTFMMGLVIIYEVYSLIHYVEKTNRDLIRFLD